MLLLWQFCDVFLLHGGQKGEEHDANDNTGFKLD